MANDKISSVVAPMTLKELHLVPGHLIRRCQQIAVAVFFEEFKGHDITPVQYAALIAIHDRPGMDQRTLVNQIAIDRSTVGAMLKTLEERDLVVRVTPKDNKRIKQLFITGAGDQLLCVTRNYIDRVQKRILAPLNAKDQLLFSELLSRIVHINNEISRAPLKLVHVPKKGQNKMPGRTFK